MCLPAAPVFRCTSDRRFNGRGWINRWNKIINKKAHKNNTDTHTNEQVCGASKQAHAQTHTLIFPYLYNDFHINESWARHEVSWQEDRGNQSALWGHNKQFVFPGVCAFLGGELCQILLISNWLNHNATGFLEKNSNSGLHALFSLWLLNNTGNKPCLSLK